MRNPFRTIEKVGGVVGWVILGAFCAAAVAACIAVAITEWGWWALLPIPGVPLGLIAILLGGALLQMLTDAIHDRWRMAKWRWDDRNAN